MRAYLEAIENHKPKRGRKRTADSISKRLESLDEEIAAADPLRRLQLIQERLTLQEELATASADGGNIEELEGRFVEVAAGYAQRKGISYAAFREVGVPAATLKAAGISRASHP